MKANCALESRCTISPVISVEVCGRAGCSALVKNLSCAALSVSTAAASLVGSKNKAPRGALLLSSSLKQSDHMEKLFFPEPHVVMWTRTSLLGVSFGKAALIAPVASIWCSLPPQCMEALSDQSCAVLCLNPWILLGFSSVKPLILSLASGQERDTALWLGCGCHVCLVSKRAGTWWAQLPADAVIQLGLMLPWILPAI